MDGADTITGIHGTIIIMVGVTMVGDTILGIGTMLTTIILTIMVGEDIMSTMAGAVLAHILIVEQVQVERLSLIGMEQV